MISGSSVFSKSSLNIWKFPVHIQLKAGLENFEQYFVPYYGRVIFHLDDPTDVGNLISGSSAFSKSSLNIWKVSVHVLLKLGLENFEHNFDSV